MMCRNIFKTPPCFKYKVFQANINFTCILTLFSWNTETIPSSGTYIDDFYITAGDGHHFLRKQPWKTCKFCVYLENTQTISHANKEKME